MSAFEIIEKFCRMCGHPLTFECVDGYPVTCPQCQRRYNAILARQGSPTADLQWMLCWREEWNEIVAYREWSSPQ